MIALFTLLLLQAEPAAADAKRAPPIQADCRADTDCLISTFPGCCGSCCAMSPVAVSKSNDEAQRRRCSIVDCAAPRCDRTECEKTEPASAFRAVCERGQCVAVRVKPGSECVSDSDCRIDWNRGGATCEPCGCCPGTGTPSAVPNSKPQPAPPPPRPLTKKDGKTPPFGLSQGPAQPPQTPPNCSPCPAPPRVRAVCSVGRCVLARENLLEE